MKLRAIFTENLVHETLFNTEVYRSNETHIIMHVDRITEYSFKFWKPWNSVKPSQSILLVAIAKTAIYTIQWCVYFYVLMDSTNVRKHTTNTLMRHQWFSKWKSRLVSRALLLTARKNQGVKCSDCSITAIVAYDMSSLLPERCMFFVPP